MTMGLKNSIPDTMEAISYKNGMVETKSFIRHKKKSHQQNGTFFNLGNRKTNLFNYISTYLIHI